MSKRLQRKLWKRRQRTSKLKGYPKRTVKGKLPFKLGTKQDTFLRMLAQGPIDMSEWGQHGRE